jgi:hypothetical protein
MNLLKVIASGELATLEVEALDDGKTLHGFAVDFESCGIPDCDH